MSFLTEFGLWRLRREAERHAENTVKRVKEEVRSYHSIAAPLTLWDASVRCTRFANGLCYLEIFDDEEIKGELVSPEFFSAWQKEFGCDI